ncbi:Hypothetical protein KNT65_gp092 [Escherichia phage EcS1]|uniref:Uncharacterized protein n=1 Tax=Escherichia phage EcS1 TaxID=2083276 RepID=A0A2Z5ZC09_9CAUD|nr:Hypothetical protein KNT65_gp092 [Escherichia phage EcS1]BBC78140.1 Hypothetical protein [Escherichia phage EcS1]
MLTKIVSDLIEENRAAYRAQRKRVEQRAYELNAGWTKSKYGRDSFDRCVSPTWGKDDRPHAPFDGYLWENELGEVEAYHAGSYLPYVTELESMDKPEYTGDHGWWKLRLTFNMYLELKAFNFIEMKAPYKLWDLGETRVGMVEVRAHKNILKAIQAHSEQWFNNYYESLKANKGEAPVGKLVVKGIVVSVKDWMDIYGPVFKMTVRLENGATVYGSLPKAVPADYRGEIEFKATFEHAKDDNTHSFFKRPSSVVFNEA